MLLYIYDLKGIILASYNNNYFLIFSIAIYWFVTCPLVQINGTFLPEFIEIFCLEFSFQKGMIAVLLKDGNYNWLGLLPVW